MIVDKYSLNRITIEQLEHWEETRPKQTVFQTSSWLKFLVMDQQIEPVILEIEQKGIIKGIFVGGIVKKLGVKILGSPFEGWMTGDMGFIALQEDFDYKEAILAIRKYAFLKLNCWFVQINDKNIPADIVIEDVKKEYITDLTLDLSGDVENIFEGFKKSTRKKLRQFTRKGAFVREIEFDEKFVNEFYEEIKDVFHKQKLKPPYSKEKLLHMSECVKKDLVYPLEVISPQGKVIATTITLGKNDWAYTLLTASYREYQNYLPNETLRWETIKYWKNKGCTHCDFCGYREYKLKFNPNVVKVPVFIMERVPGLLYAKKKAKKAIVILRTIRGLIKNRGVHFD